MTHLPLHHTAIHPTTPRPNETGPRFAGTSPSGSSIDLNADKSIDLPSSNRFDSAVITAGSDESGSSYSSDTPADPNAGSMAAGSDRSHATPKNNRATVYIIEPESLFRQMLKTAIDQLGNFHVVGSAPDFSAAEDLLSRQPEILVTEMFIAGRALSALIDQIRPIMGKTKVLVLTRDADPTIGRQLQHLPAYGIVSKQEDPEKLFQTLEQLRLSRADGTERQVTAPPVSSKASEDPITCLSPREREIFQLLADGLQNTVIAKKLFISPRTVGTHRARVVRKLGLTSNGDLIRFAIKHGLSSL